MSGLKEIKGANVCKASLKPREKHRLLAGGIMFRQIGIPPNMVLSFRLELPKSYLSSLA